MAHFERLSALDQSFLAWERPDVRMHVASTLVFDAGPLRTEEGGIDVQAVKKAVAAALPRIPRYRQRLAFIPLEGRGAWVDAPDFDLDDHVRHLALPRPGSDAQLEEIAARIMEQPLDRRRPLWEMWVVEGLAGDRFAIVSKVHHCMIDGISGVDLLMMLLSGDPDASIAEPPPWHPRPAPSAFELVRSELVRRARLPLDLFRGAGNVIAELRDVRGEARTRLRAVARLVRRTLRPASRTPLNGPIGPRRRLEWWTQDLDEVKRTARALRCTVNDVVLATVTGAVRRYLRRRSLDLRDLTFRALVPVSVRTAEERRTLGNRVSIWLVELPLATSRARARVRRIRRQTVRLKRERDGLGAELLAQVADWTSSTLLSVGSRAAFSLLPFNLVVTNVPGPQVPLYLLGARLREAHPHAPLFENLGLSVALLSYDGRLCWGLNADGGRVPDVASLREDLECAFEELKDDVERGGRRPSASAGAARTRKGGRS